MSEAKKTALRAARLRAGMTQVALADALGVSSATLSRAETGLGPLSLERIDLAAQLLDAPIEELLGSHAVARSSEPPPAVPGLYAEDGRGSWRTYDELRLAPPLRAALEAFLAYGYHGTSVRDIAKLAGLSVPGLYHHHATKQSLLVAIMDLTMNDFRARCLAARSEGGTPVERFTLLVECFALFHGYRRELAFIGASEMRSLQGEDRRRIAVIRAECQHFVTEEVEQIAVGGLLATPYPEDAARAVVTMLVGIANWYRDDGLLTPEQVARRYVVHSAALIQLRSA